MDHKGGISQRNNPGGGEPGGGSGERVAGRRVPHGQLGFRMGPRAGAAAGGNREAWGESPFLIFVFCLFSDLRIFDFFVFEVLKF